MSYMISITPLFMRIYEPNEQHKEGYHTAYSPLKNISPIAFTYIPYQSAEAAEQKITRKWG